jgi:hypothetical protein
MIGTTGDSTLLLNNWMLFLKLRELVVVLRVCDGDFMVVVMVVMIDTVALSEWLLDTLSAQRGWRK